MTQAYEINFDSIIGPTHNYGGLSYGNVASIDNQKSPSNPREAALQGLEKMNFLHSLGLKQALFPPHERPHIPTLKALGFRGTDAAILAHVQQADPHILIQCSSASAMWAANAATFCPSIDSSDKKAHFTPANLSSKFHRSIEHKFTSVLLKNIFKDPHYFVHHEALPSGHHFDDEGAANHTRFCSDYGSGGVQLFVFGRYSFRTNPLASHRFPARQAYEASQAIARLHQIFPGRCIFAQQNPLAIDEGVFHNDVISVGNRNVFLYHESAFIGTEGVIEDIQSRMSELSDNPMYFIKVPEDKVSIQDAVASYLFNSQLISLNDENMALIAPTECKESRPVQRMLDEIIYTQKNPINAVHYLDLRQSMRNGGGPACLRLRVTLSELELAAIQQEVLFTEKLYNKLKDWVQKHYRDRLHPQDLADPQLLQESRQALDELTKILNLGSIYPFQI